LREQGAPAQRHRGGAGQQDSDMPTVARAEHAGEKHERASIVARARDAKLP